MSIEKAKEFVEDYSIDDISIFNRQNEHFFLYDLLEEYSKTFTPQPTNSLDELESFISEYVELSGKPTIRVIDIKMLLSEIKSLKSKYEKYK